MKKTSYRGKGRKTAKKGKKSGLKWVVLGVTFTLSALLALTIALKIRDYIREEREKEYARLEAEMKAEVFTFTIVPGDTIFDIQKKLISVGYSEKEVLEAFKANYDFDFLPKGAELEGYLYGETYEFYKSASVREVLTKYLEKMGEVIRTNDLETKYSALGLTLHEGITLASVVQKESPGPEMPTVAQVFLSRLGYGWKLGSDVTVSYALDILDPERKIYTDNLAALSVDSCYNTRLYTGLPCGPISNPGLTALLAVTNPSDTSYLYFLTGDDNLMYYSDTEAGHNQNIRDHCQVLCNVSL
ncbi:MAG: endolytic transglycosylase MltG [Candidatus Saccharibacteria bacterium]|nr:endolytic transglycosylase MltG [Candidatus Saccharibacteria bacterium]